MSYRTPQGRVENYTKPFLILFGINVFTWFLIILNIWGVFGIVLATGLFDLLVRRLTHRRR